ncbi:hypothetical protein B0H34DRAFT_234914 [Crassisporium funariophilum]|nr:hypothetical protein B0H34DRAFT_234914 [Crassisporium funariophilum]
MTQSIQWIAQVDRVYRSFFLFTLTTKMKFLFLALYTAPVVFATRLPSLFVQHHDQLNVPDIKVPVQLGVMSRCPDALLCESTFNDVLTHVKDKVDLSLIYVAKIDASQPDFGVWCMHGPEECAGNVQQLCVHKYAPFSQWWEFVQCQNYQGRDKIGGSDVALRCARNAGIDWETSGAGQCAGLDGTGKGSEGVALLKESAALGNKMGITCTVLISSRPVCIHDGTWKDCENGHTVKDFVRQIEDEYERLNGNSIQG